MPEERQPLACIRRVLQEMPPKFDPPTEGFLRCQGLDTSRIRPMGLNECLFAPSPKVIAAIQANLARINRYPDAQCPAVGELVSRRTGVPMTRIVWGNGSEELIQGAVQLTSSPGDRVVLPVPTFWGYRAIVRAAGMEITEAPNRADGMPDVDRIVAAVDARTHLAFCVTPNNPSGSMLCAADFARLAQRVPDDVLLFVDEAYHEFGAAAGGPDILALLAARRGPWIVARTFSKAYAMAGMRIGYALCSAEEVAQALKKTTCVFNVPLLAQAAALAALEDADHLARVLALTAAGRAQLDAGFRALGLAPMASVGNFVSVRLPLPGAQAVGAMLERGVQIHAWPDPGFERFVRITVGAHEDNLACLEALAEVLAAAKPQRSIA
ncbi:MAG: histidinol-phosphate aminotransferase family protein [Burkholderiales bacterium]|nr:histidinol-phosphate aminotransferase family protein [Burkholderiales bacterium]